MDYEEIVNVMEYGHYCRVYLEGLDEPVCFMEDEYGFIHEISNEEYEAMIDKYDDFFAEDEEE